MVYRPQIISHDLKRPISIAVLDNWVEIPVPSPKKVYLREVLFHYFNMKYTVYQSYNILLHIYGDQSLGIRKCYKWHKQFKSRNFDFVVEKQAGPPKNSKMSNWRCYSLKIIHKRKKYLQKDSMSLSELFHIV